MENNVDIVIIGNIAYDINYFKYKEKIIENKNVGGACLYSALPASLYARVGIVSRVSDKFDLNLFKKYNVDLKGLKILKNEKQTQFVNNYINELDRKERIVEEYVNNNLIVKKEDIPKEYLKAKYIHITTNYPKVQLELIKYIRKHSNAIISVDTIAGYSKLEDIKEVFNLVDIAFIDKQFVDLIDCKAELKIIKNGKTGCTLISDNLKKNVYSIPKEDVVDKTGAGDCLNGVFIANLSKGVDKIFALEEAIKIASYSIDFYGILDIYKYKEGE